MRDLTGRNWRWCCPSVLNSTTRYSPKHASWLNIAQIELSALCGQCLNRRIPDRKTMRREIKAWDRDRNNHQTKVDWQFTTSDAHVTLRILYPKI